MAEVLEGGCQCGAIRYEIDDVFDVVYCHCSQCRKRTGAPVNCAIQIAGDAFRLTKGAPKAYEISVLGRWHFCSDCGSSVCFEGVEPDHPLARNSRHYSVSVGSLDDPERIRPQIHQFVENKLSWFEIADNLPRVQDNVLPHPERR